MRPANNALERTVRHGGPRLAAASAWWPLNSVVRQQRMIVIANFGRALIPYAPEGQRHSQAPE